ncbi:branched-chain amino acid ABC transporter permease [Devosia yakushimensis]|uniref:Branched-chain amino acid ABC transporter permease n=1 Tax=Devosia yakushimensis TaxID=470028 RepID=A0ABQ5UKK3_9HYPH|nr:branched-chain amino acid ABC transporter permease [Devosia yakushimensis]GLQ11664.1 branched-chain amino acid ABC transporter permease [Devosia yakushimensis]
MIQRSLTLFAGLFVLILVIGWLMGLPFTSSRLVEAAAYSLIALGLNIQWGYGGLFNFGIMGFLMLGGFAVTFISYPVNPTFWGSDGPLMLGRALLAFAAGALLVIAARKSDRIGLRGGWKTFVTVLAWFVAYCLYRSQLDPAAAYIESAAGGGWVGGLGAHPILGWLFGGVLAAVIAFIVGKIALGLRTDYLAIATIGISEIIRALIKNMDWLTRGTLTVSPIPWPTPLPQDYQASGSDQFSSLLLARGGFLLLALAVLAIALWLISRAYSGPWGRMMRAIRDNHIAAASMGKNVTARQLEIFVFGSVLMGIGGAMLVSFTQIFDPSSYQPINHTFLIWVMVIVGGAGNNWGAVFGAVLIWLVWIISEPLSKVVFDFVSMWSSNFGWGAIPDIEARSAQMRVFVLGLVITIALRFAPRGLIPEMVKREG